MLQVQTPDKLIQYKHNAIGNRVEKKADGVVTEKYLWLDKTTLLAIYDKDDVLLQRYQYTDGNTPASFTQAGQTYYIVTDHLGTPRAITDAAGAIVKKLDYDSFGNVISDSNPGFGIPFGFAGGLQDNDTGLIRFGFRDYDPDVGRWTARDPIGFSGGDTNLYGYVLNDPINFIDTNGESAGAFQKFLQAVTTVFWLFTGGVDDGKATRPPGPTRENTESIERARENKKQTNKKSGGKKFGVPDPYTIQDAICQAMGEGCLPGQLDEKDNPFMCMDMREEVFEFDLA